MDYDRIFPRLWVGSCPHDEREVGRLVQEARISAILCLLSDEDIERLELDWPHLEEFGRLRRIEMSRLPVTDGDTRDLQGKLPECVRLLDRLLAAGHSVYLHCAAGIERSPSVAVAYLYWVLGYELEEAAAYVGGCRGCSPDLDAIRMATRELLCGEAVRIDREASMDSPDAGRAAREAAERRVLRELIVQRP
jgi:hypothetical protein